MNNNNIMNTNNTILQNDCNFYFMYRINKYEWKYFLDRPFITTTTQDNIYGQFISSNWFKCLIKPTDIIEIIVIKLPKRRNKIHPDNNNTIDMILYYLTIIDNYDDLNFVVMYYKYDVDYLNSICNVKLNENLNNENKSINKIIKINDNKEFGMTFGCSVTKQKNNLIEVLKKEYYITCPNFVFKTKLI